MTDQSSVPKENPIVEPMSPPEKPTSNLSISKLPTSLIRWVAHSPAYKFAHEKVLSAISLLEYVPGYGLVKPQYDKIMEHATQIQERVQRAMTPNIVLKIYETASRAYLNLHHYMENAELGKEQDSNEQLIAFLNETKRLCKLARVPMGFDFVQVLTQYHSCISNVWKGPAKDDLDALVRIHKAYSTFLNLTLKNEESEIFYTHYEDPKITSKDLYLQKIIESLDQKDKELGQKLSEEYFRLRNLNLSAYNDEKLIEIGKLKTLLYKLKVALRELSIVATEDVLAIYESLVSYIYTEAVDNWIKSTKPSTSYEYSTLCEHFSAINSKIYNTLDYRVDCVLNAITENKIYQFIDNYTNITGMVKYMYGKAVIVKDCVSQSFQSLGKGIYAVYDYSTNKVSVVIDLVIHPTVALKLLGQVYANCKVTVTEYVMKLDFDGDGSISFADIKETIMGILKDIWEFEYLEEVKKRGTSLYQRVVKMIKCNEEDEPESKKNK